MSDGWRRLDLAGGGLQQANLALARRLKRRRHAYALLAAAPLGLHRRYLGSPRGVWAWRVLSLAAVALWIADLRLGAVALAAFAAALIAEAIWIDRRVTILNKALRREVYLGQAATPPAGYRGRFPEEVPRGPRAASFAAQERRLRALASERGDGADGRPES